MASAEVKVDAEAKTIGADIAKLAAYIHVKNYGSFNCAAGSQKALVEYITNEIWTAVRERHPSSLKFKLDTGARVQLIIIMRMIYAATLQSKFDESTEVDAIADGFALGSLERDLFKWFAGIVKANGQTWDAIWNVISSDEIPKEIAAVTAEYKEAATGGGEFDPRFAEVAIIVITRAISKVARDMIGAKVELSKAKTVDLDSFELNGYFRLLNDVGQIGTGLFATIGRAADQLHDAREIWDVQTKDEREAKKKAAAEEKARKAAEKAAKPKVAKKR